VTNKKSYTLNGILEEEFVFNFIIEPDILEYLNNKNLIVNLFTQNRADFQLESEELSSDDEYSKNLVGTAKIKLNDILSNTDFINKNIPVVSRISTNTNLGHINIDMKLENTNALELRKELKQKATLKAEQTKLISQYELSNKNPFDSLKFYSPKQKTQVPPKKFEFIDQYTDLDYNELWEKLNQNTVNAY
jgi:hypothetical protein